MKKYLMTGVAALAICAAFTSCSKGGELFDEGAVNEMKEAQVVEKYNQAFIKVFGQPAEDQEWGFKGYASGTRGEFANGNEWAATYKVPDPLTEEQINVVRQYFQQVKGRKYEDPRMTEFFMQQVYKGATTVGEGSGTKSPEVYSSVANTGIVGSDHMNHLAAVFPDGTIDHINNFNNGDCGTYGNVLDNGQPINGGTTHPDKIMLMKESTTHLFCYHNSDGSLSHSDYTTLVHWTTIRDWANRVLGAGKGDCLDDKWNRSYMGFDFEQRVGPDCYAYDNSGALKNMTFSGEYYVNGEKKTNYVYQYNNKPVPMLSTNTNLYCGQKMNVQDSQLYSDERDVANNNAYLGKKLNTDFIDGLLAQGYLPVADKEFREWVIIGGCADQYYSDWIVTLTKAEPIDEPDPSVVRIIAEDLSASDATDFDFNDVVFDVTFNADGSVGTVQLVAAGGVYPLTVDGHEVHAAFGHPETDSRGYFKMINTHSAIDGVDGATAAPFNVANPGENGRNIKIMVNKFEKKEDGTVVDHWYELEAKRGIPAAKLCVNQTFQYCGERVPITTPYPTFGAWVRGNKYIWW